MLCQIITRLILLYSCKYSQNLMGRVDGSNVSGAKPKLTNISFPFTSSCATIPATANIARRPFCNSLVDMAEKSSKLSGFSPSGSKPMSPVLLTTSTLQKRGFITTCIMEDLREQWMSVQKEQGKIYYNRKHEAIQ